MLSMQRPLLVTDPGIARLPMVTNAVRDCEIVLHEAAMPSVPPRVRSPKVQGRIEATMPKTTSARAIRSR